MRKTILALLTALGIVVSASPAGAAAGPYVYNDGTRTVQVLYRGADLGTYVDFVRPGESSVRGAFTVRPYPGDRVIITIRSYSTGRYYYAPYCGAALAIGNDAKVMSTTPC